MRALWVTNAPVPAAAAALGVPVTGFPSWVEAAHRAILDRGGVRVDLAFPSGGEPRVVSTDERSVATLPVVDTVGDEGILAAVEQVLRRLSPDIVHVFGTEGAHAHEVARACRRLRIPFVIALQGLSSTLGLHYTSGLPARVIHGFTLRDFVRRDNIAAQAGHYRSMGEVEARTIALTGHVIGRTTWDRAVSEQLNPDARYHTVPETLRPSFYEHRWRIEDCTPSSIFVSQGHYPVKGLHFLVRALPTIIRRHPDTRVVVSGWPLRGPGLRGRVRQTGYAAYVSRLARDLGVTDRLTFVGVLDEQAMVRQFLASHVYVSSSTVENESNSLSEARVLGLPVVASYVGGVVDRVDHGRTGLHYQHDAPYMLAHHVSALLDDPDLCRRLGAAAREDALRLNDAARNAETLYAVYLRILGDDP